jgi:hypothetical protein
MINDAHQFDFFFRPQFNTTSLLSKNLEGKDDIVTRFFLQTDMARIWHYSGFAQELIINEDEGKIEEMEQLGISETRKFGRSLFLYNEFSYFLQQEQFRARVEFGYAGGQLGIMF